MSAMSEQFRFQFTLDPLSEIPSYHWFDMSSGSYWIETPVGDALRYTSETVECWDLSSDAVDYNVARQFWDLMDVLPYTLQPIPQDIADIGTNLAFLSWTGHWIEEADDDADASNRISLYDAAVGWRDDRVINMNYLREGPNILIWRVADRVHFRWQSQPPDQKKPADFLRAFRRVHNERADV